MKATFLGTGTSQGVPVIVCECSVCNSDNPKDKRLRTSIMLDVDGIIFVIDTGPDFRQQILRENVRKIDAVFFTHSHKDHVAGLDDIRPFNYRYKIDMPVYADAYTIEALKREFSYIFSGAGYPGIPKLEIHEIDSYPFDVKNIKIIPIPVLHYKMPVLGFRIEDFAYITDANHIPPDSMEKLQNLDVLVLNALHREEHISHFNLNQAIEIVKQLRPNRAFFTHISHNMGHYEDVMNELPEGISLAYDGLVVESLSYSDISEF